MPRWDCTGSPVRMHPSGDLSTLWDKAGSYSQGCRSGGPHRVTAQRSQPDTTAARLCFSSPLDSAGRPDSGDFLSSGAQEVAHSGEGLLGTRMFIPVETWSDQLPRAVGMEMAPWHRLLGLPPKPGTSLKHFLLYLRMEAGGTPSNSQGLRPAPCSWSL